MHSTSGLTKVCYYKGTVAKKTKKHKMNIYKIKHNIMMDPEVLAGLPKICSVLRIKLLFCFVF